LLRKLKGTKVEEDDPSDQSTTGNTNRFLDKFNLSVLHVFYLPMG